MWSALAALLVGLVWGVTNPFVKRGSVRQAQRASQGEGWRSWLAVAPAYLCNQSGSLLFILLLASGDISRAVPVANAVSIAANAVTDLALGERYQLELLAPGCALVGAGVLLCAL